jgi:hypothetical protein
MLFCVGETAESRDGALSTIKVHIIPIFYKFCGREIAYAEHSEIQGTQRLCAWVDRTGNPHFLHAARGAHLPIAAVFANRVQKYPSVAH